MIWNKNWLKSDWASLTFTVWISAMLD